MKYINLEQELIRKQACYIRQLEEQLALYKEKDQAQEQLMEHMDQVLNALSDEVSRLKQENR